MTVGHSCLRYVLSATRFGVEWTGEHFGTFLLCIVLSLSLSLFVTELCLLSPDKIELKVCLHNTGMCLCHTRCIQNSAASPPPVIVALVRKVKMRCHVGV